MWVLAPQRSYEKTFQTSPSTLGAQPLRSNHTEAQGKGHACSVPVLMGVGKLRSSLLVHLMHLNAALESRECEVGGKSRPCPELWDAGY